MSEERKCGICNGIGWRFGFGLCFACRGTGKIGPAPVPGKPAAGVGGLEQADPKSPGGGR